MTIIPLTAAAAAAAAAMPLPPPEQILVGVGDIPERRGGPLIPFPTETVPAVQWSCETTVNGGQTVRMSGSFDSIEPNGSRGPVPKWPPFTLAKVSPDPSHHFAGTYLATYSANVATIYGFRFAYAGDAYEVTVRLHGFKEPATIELMRLGETDWVLMGKGTCNGRYLDSKGHSVQ